MLDETARIPFGKRYDGRTVQFPAFQRQGEKRQDDGDVDAIAPFRKDDESKIGQEGGTQEQGVAGHDPRFPQESRRNDPFPLPSRFHEHFHRDLEQETQDKGQDPVDPGRKVTDAFPHQRIDGISLNLDTRHLPQRRDMGIPFFPETTEQDNLPFQEIGRILDGIGRNHAETDIPVVDQPVFPVIIQGTAGILLHDGSRKRLDHFLTEPVPDTELPDRQVVQIVLQIGISFFHGDTVDEEGMDRGSKARLLTVVIRQFTSEDHIVSVCTDHVQKPGIALSIRSDPFEDGIHPDAGGIAQDDTFQQDGDVPSVFDVTDIHNRDRTALLRPAVMLDVEKQVGDAESFQRLGDRIEKGNIVGHNRQYAQQDERSDHDQQMIAMEKESSGCPFGSHISGQK